MKELAEQIANLMGIGETPTDRVLGLLGVTGEMRSPGTEKLREAHCVFLHGDGSGKMVAARHWDRESTMSIDRSIAMEWLKFRPEILRVTTNNGFTKAGLTDAFNGTNLGNRLWDTNESWKLSRYGQKVAYWNKDKKRFIIKRSPFVPRAVWVKLALRALKVIGRSEDELLSAHPSWVFENNAFLIVLASKGTTTWSRTCSQFGIKNSTATFLRSGKDIYNVPVKGTKIGCLRLYVIPSTGTAEGDGVFHVLESSLPELAGWFGLVRGCGSEYPLTIVKGRMIVSDKLALTLPDGSTLPEGFDGWTTTDNLKWNVPESNDIFVNLIHSTEETGHHQDAYRMNLLPLLIGRFNDGDRKWLMNRFGKAVEKTAKKLNDPFSNFAETIREFSLETTGALQASDFAKVFLGIGTPEDIHNVYRNIVAGARSIKERRTAYFAIGHARSVDGIPVTPDHPVVNTSLARKLKSEGVWNQWFTMRRDPVISHQSYGAIRVNKEVEGIVKDPMMWIHPDAAPYFKSDGDDHGMGSLDIVSLFKVSDKESSIVVRPEEVKGETSLLDAYFKPAIALDTVGYIFNMMVKMDTACVVAGLSPAERELAACEFGGALDRVVQNQKKDRKDVNLWEIDAKLAKVLRLIEKMEVVKCERQYLTDIATNKCNRPDDGEVYRSAAAMLWNVDFPATLNSRKETFTLNGLPTEFNRRLVNEALKAAENVKKLGPALAWHDRLMKAMGRMLGMNKSFIACLWDIAEMRGQDSMALEPQLLRALNTYTIIAYNIKGNGLDNNLLKVLNGNLLIAAQIAVRPDSEPATEITTIVPDTPPYK